MRFLQKQLKVIHIYFVRVESINKVLTIEFFSEQIANIDGSSVIARILLQDECVKSRDMHRKNDFNR